MKELLITAYQNFISSTSKTSIKTIFFDVGGVLIKDFSKTNKWEQMLDGLELTNEQRKVFEELFDIHESLICSGEDPQIFIDKFQVEGGWGSLMILIDPNIIRDIIDFKNDVATAIKELKDSPKMRGFNEIYYPGEQSPKNRLKALQEGEFEIDDKLFSDLQSLL